MKLAIEYNGEEVGTLIYYIVKDKKENRGYINYIDVLEKYRGKGMATCLLWNLYDILYKNGVKCIEFDDCSDLYRDKNNIYLKIGAKYIEESGPEMIWKIWTKYVRKLREEYKNNNEYRILFS
jgi:ribosomal protein S18 acetylase RimI-like enzyme